MYTPRTSVEAIPDASIHHSALQNRDFGHTYDRSRALVRALVSRHLAAVRFHARARGVFIFVRNFSRGIFLRESLSKVIDDLTTCASISRDQIKGAY